MHKTVLTASRSTSVHNGVPNAPDIPFHILQWHQGNLGFQGNTKGDAVHHCVLMRPALHSKQCLYGPHGKTLHILVLLVQSRLFFSLQLLPLGLKLFCCHLMGLNNSASHPWFPTLGTTILRNTQG